MPQLLTTKTVALPPWRLGLAHQRHPHVAHPPALAADAAHPLLEVVLEWRLGRLQRRAPGGAMGGRGWDRLEADAIAQPFGPPRGPTGSGPSAGPGCPCGSSPSVACPHSPRDRGDEAGRHQAMPHPFGDPGGIGLIRLAPRPLLDVGRVHQEDGEVACPDVADRLPVLSRAFHGHMRDAGRGQPVGQGQQVDWLVPKALSSMIPSACCAVGLGVTRHAMTVFLCTSNPAQGVKTTSIAHRQWQAGLAGYPYRKSLPCVLCFRREASDHPWCRQVSGSNGCTGSRHLHSKPTSRPAPWDALYPDGRAQGHR